MTAPLMRRRGTRARRSESGQGLVEFAVILPVFALCLLGMLEMGLLFNHHLTIEYATREGSRTGSALSDGGSTNCVGNVDAVNIDGQVVAAVQRVIKSPGSPVLLSNVTEIRIFKADASGNQIGSLANIWKYTPGAGPDIDTSSGVDRLDFSPNSVGWPACSRQFAPSADSMGVRIVYSYPFQTPLGAIARMFNNPTATLLTIDDKTVMALNPQI